MIYLKRTMVGIVALFVATILYMRTRNSSGLLITVSPRRTRPALSYIFSQFSLTRCLMRDPSMRQAQLERSEMISPSKLPRRFRPLLDGCALSGLHSQDRKSVVVGIEVIAGVE